MKKPGPVLGEINFRLGSDSKLIVRTTDLSFIVNQRLVSAAIASLLFALVSNAQQWRPVSNNRQANISGMALIEHNKQYSSFLIVHDNKKKGQTRVAIITVDGAEWPKYAPLEWRGKDIPVDLESVTSIPGSPGQFIALTSAGRAFHIKLDAAANAVEPVNSFDVPMIPKDPKFEAFAVQKIEGAMIAVWADRGLNERPATLFWSGFDPAIGIFSAVRSASLKVPYPLLDVRHVSDVKVDAAGAVFVTSASDPGNDGPFSSAMYFAGVLRPAADKAFNFVQPPVLTRLFHFDSHKVEAFEFIPGADGGVVFGTDDENLGAALLMPNV